MTGGGEPGHDQGCEEAPLELGPAGPEQSTALGGWPFPREIPSAPWPECQPSSSPARPTQRHSSLALLPESQLLPHLSSRSPELLLSCSRPPLVYRQPGVSTGPHVTRPLAAPRLPFLSLFWCPPGRRSFPARIPQLHLPPALASCSEPHPQHAGIAIHDCPGPPTPAWGKWLPGPGTYLHRWSPTCSRTTGSSRIWKVSAGR